MAVAQNFPVAGIGASAGGIEALQGVFRGLPERPGLAFVIVMHLNPDRESLLPEVISRFTRLPVRVAEDGQEVQVDEVYVVPADVVVGMRNRRLLVRRSDSGRRERKPIDVFLSALAVDVGELAAGVVLSGGDGDGTLGIKAIKEHGGLTLAQVADGTGPQHRDMPDSAISTGLVDFAVPASEMGAKLAEFARAALGPEDPAEPDRLSDTVVAARDDINAILRNQVGHDFSGYKTRTFVRRVQRRMQMSGLATVAGYLERMRQQPEEVATLFRDLLINVTNFFRDIEAFEALAQQVIPALFEGRGAEDSVRVWVPGCSTGEEVFTLGMLMREHMDTLTAVPRVQIFATDIDEHSLGVARAARYPAPLLEAVPAARRKRFFIADGASYMVAKEVRDLCTFSPHSVIRDPPFSRIDLISCRNLLIYFGLDAQHQVIPTFHYALRPDGFLFLGSSESISQFPDLFTPVDKKHRIFRRRGDVSASLRLPMMVSSLRSGPGPEVALRRSSMVGVALRQAVDAQVLDRFSPPHVVVNRDGDIVYYSGRTGKYLEAAAGVPTRQLLTTARRSLRLDLRGLMREVVESGRPATREGIPVEGEDGRVQLVELAVEPMLGRADGDPLYLVLFVDQGPVLSREEAQVRARVANDGSAQQTERELRDTRERLQSMIEEYETAVEELKSSNEETVSVNEELQSTNEELEASKEELVSVNEELQTVNAELTGKVEALDRANSDLLNLFESSDIATVFLDRSLKIRSFTPAMTRIFHILPSDRGRPITDLSSRFSLPSFAEDIAGMLAGGKALERRVNDTDGAAHYLIRMAPYRHHLLPSDGVVVTFVDISSVIAAEARQRVLIAELQHRTRNLLAVVQSVAYQTLARGPALEAFMVRLAAMGRVQGLLSSSSNESVDFGDLVRLELQAHGSLGNRVRLSGPPVALDVERVQSLALAVHELATNAVKHGALGAELGRVDIAWRLEHDADRGELLVLDWRESGLTRPPVSDRRGFGRKMIEQALAFTLQAKSEMTFLPDGIACRIELPIGPPAAAMALPD